MTGPDKHTLFPLPHHRKLCYLKNLVTNPNIIVGDYTYYDDFEDVRNFESNVKYHFDFIGDKLIIGKFCMIASGASFIMNGGNHLSDSVSAYPFAIFGNGWEQAMDGREYPVKGDTVIGNDVWIGHNATIMPGLTVGDGAIIAANATVAHRLNQKKDEMVGSNIFDAVPKEVAELRRSFFDNAVKTRKPVQFQDVRFDKIIDNRINPIIDQDGNISRLAIIGIDITERKQAEEELKTQYRLLKIAGETAKFGGWDADLKTNIVTWSDAVADIHEMPHGYAPPAEEGINFYAPEWREKITQVFTDCATKGISYDEEMEIITSKGKQLWVRTIGRAQKDENGKIIKVHGSFQDITDHK